MEYYVVKYSDEVVTNYCIEHKIALMLSYYADKNSAYKNFLEPRKKRLEQGLENGKLFMDSGAFTAWTKGAVINVDEYCKYINENGEYVDYFGQLDTIPKVGGTAQEAAEAAQKTLENYFEMISKVKYPEKIVYTFHVGEPEEVLRQALEWGSKNKDKMKMIAIGGLVRKNSNDKNSVITRAFNVINEIYPDVRVHLFGCTSPQYFLDYPAHSGDSSNHIMSAINGHVNTPAGLIGFGEKLIKNHYNNLRYDEKELVDKYLEEIELPAEKLFEDSKNRVLANIKYIEREFYNKKITNENRRKNGRLF